MGIGPCVLVTFAWVCPLTDEPSCRSGASNCDLHKPEKKEHVEPWRIVEGGNTGRRREDQMFMLYIFMAKVLVHVPRSMIL